MLNNLVENSKEEKNYPISRQSQSCFPKVKRASFQRFTQKNLYGENVFSCLDVCLEKGQSNEEMKKRHFSMKLTGV